MIVVRLPCSALLPEPLLAMARRWTQTSIIGVFCGDRDVGGGDLRGILDTLDDFILCPFCTLELTERIRRMIPESERPLHPGTRVREDLKLDFLVGESRCFLDTIQIVPLLAASGASLLITGETGTGKELFAHAVHYNSKRRGHSFIPVNCGALPDHLLENELFGHTKGAYTGATTTENGLIAVAEGGTLFLDEVDSLSAAAQVKLLRFLQDREYRPLGSSRIVTADVRVIAATNKSLRRTVEAGGMREDLFYRLNLLSVHIPSVREREGDIPILAEHMLSKYAAQYDRGTLTFLPGVTRRLAMLQWPGNVRELEALIHRAVVMTQSDVIRFEDLGLTPAEPDETIRAMPMRVAKARQVAEFEREYLEQILARNGGNVSRAARESGKDRRTFQRLLQKHRIERACG
jgi:transcriptional regulator with PAS, ATPase and Fis domain